MLIRCILHFQITTTLDFSILQIDRNLTIKKKHLYIVLLLLIIKKDFLWMQKEQKQSEMKLNREVIN